MKIRRINFNDVNDIKNHAKACELLFNNIKANGGTLPFAEQYYMGYSIGGDMRLDHIDRWVKYLVIENDEGSFAHILFYLPTDNPRDFNDYFPLFLIMPIEKPSDADLKEAYLDMKDYVKNLKFDNIFVHVVLNYPIEKLIDIKEKVKFAELGCLDIVRL